MIIRLQRASNADDRAPLMLYDQTGTIVDFIDPTPEIHTMMEGEAGFFEAERTETGWDVKHPVGDPHWP